MIAAAALMLAGAAECSAAARVVVPDVRIERATLVAPGFRPPDARAAPVDVGFCRVEGLIEKEIGFELWLPIGAVWNGKLLTGGVGGQAGNYNYRELSRGVRRGYAAATTDTGHRASDVHWLLGDTMRAANYAERANHLLAVKAKALIAAYYGRAVSRAIFIGCSGGGRQAMTEAQRYPYDYDGIIAGAPGVNTPEMSARRMWEMVEHSRNAGLVSEAQWRFVARAGIAACDRDDGVADGVVTNPARCRFRVAALRCRPGQTTECLTPAQIAFVERIYAPLYDENGRRIDGGLLPGVPVSAVQLPEPFTPGPTYLAVALFGDGVHRDANWNARGFNIARDLPAIDRVMNLHADDSDLSRFAARGGKLILYQGWMDPLVVAQSTTDYVDAVRDRFGKRSDGFLRYFLAPGVEHCVGGTGADTFGGAGGDSVARTPEHDMLSALEAWLDGGAAPERIVATKRSEGGTAFTRILCAYPAEARYRRGPQVAATSYACAP